MAAAIVNASLDEPTAVGRALLNALDPYESDCLNTDTSTTTGNFFHFLMLIATAQVSTGFSS
jgi:hypothetical protein